MDCIAVSPVYASMILLGDNLDVLSGGGGWVGAGLLGCVLAWVFFVRLPANDRQLVVKDQQWVEMQKSKDDLIKELQISKDNLLKSLIADCDKHNSEIVLAFNASLTQQRVDFQESLKFIAQQNERYIGSITEALRQEMKNLTLRQVENLTIVPPKGAKDANRSGS